MKPIGQLDTTHAMFQPRKRATTCGRPKVHAETVGNPHGSQSEREAWMRQRQKERNENLYRNVPRV